MKDSALTVVHSNDLVEAAYTLSIDEMRLIGLAATKVDSRKENPGEIKISPREFAQAFNLNPDFVHANLKKAVKSIMRKPIVMSEGGKTEEYAWLTKNSYHVDSREGAAVTLKFSPEITPYLFDLKERFTIISFDNLTKLNTRFSFRLYQWLIKAKNLNSRKNNTETCVELDIEWMKKQSGLSGKYERWGDFKEYVLTPAVEKINNNTDLSVLWEPKRTGRSYRKVNFRYVIDEKRHFSKPQRPRLKRRPQVQAGSSEEGYWMRENLKRLMDYESASLKFNKQFNFTISDLKRVVEYTAKTGHPSAKRYQELLATRCRKNKRL
ncbi:replication initiation protein [Photobacterium sp. OFAV2-7]|uniref:replication initiation protein n=1 Tax=Photobacterium sp. OFAV2-7 TaxID=2917748 RepID=UPI001EF71433|nr:replication initiation protein [Photobacterium sp. OFAV2-7]MCG7584574.1 replication initiation protein [Photobacterium sp. OFAV2-7]